MTTPKIRMKKGIETKNCLLCKQIKKHPNGHYYCRYWSCVTKSHYCTDFK